MKLVGWLVGWLVKVHWTALIVTASALKKIKPKVNTELQFHLIVVFPPLRVLMLYYHNSVATVWVIEALYVT
jgi:hypothetical protein